MGLDQMWVHKDPNAASSEDTDGEIFQSHRKNPALEAFMADKYAETNEGEFNCEELVITEELLDELEYAAAEEGQGLDPDASGFFWGAHYPEHLGEIEEAVTQARKYLEKGHEVIYTSWW